MMMMMMVMVMVVMAADVTEMSSQQRDLSLQNCSEFRSQKCADF